MLIESQTKHDVDSCIELIIHFLCAHEDNRFPFD
jgi:hypothetical protein